MAIERVSMQAGARRLTFLEFFAGGGLARVGLGPEWRCLFANDVDARKCAAYRANFGADSILEKDLAAVGLDELPKARADLAWGSFPCQDVSLAGARAGLKGARSRLFFEFSRRLRALRDAGRGPRLVVIENVQGLLTSNGGADFCAVVAALADLDFCVSALVLNAEAFAPQSRPRLFIFGFLADASPDLVPNSPVDPAAPAALHAAVSRLDRAARNRWGWLALRPPRGRNAALADIVDFEAPDWSRAKGAAALAQMSALQRARVERLARSGARHVGAGFRRIRIENGARVQRFEARFDGLAGCLRTPAGGSSRQMLLKLERGDVAARLMNAREAARVMGAPADYILPDRATDALKLLGDGVSPPVVRWIASEILEPALRARRAAA